LNPGLSVSSLPPPPKSRRKVYIALGALITAAAATAGFISQSPEALGESYDRAKVAATALSGPWSNGSATDGVGEAPNAAGTVAPVVSVDELATADDEQRQAADKANKDSEKAQAENDDGEKNAKRNARPRRVPVWRPPPKPVPVDTRPAPAPVVATEPDVGF